MTPAHSLRAATHIAERAETDIVVQTGNEETVMRSAIPVTLMLTLLAGAATAVANDRPASPVQTTAIDDNSTGPFNPNEPRDPPMRGRTS